MHALSAVTIVTTTAYSFTEIYFTYGIGIGRLTPTFALTHSTVLHRVFIQNPSYSIVSVYVDDIDIDDDHNDNDNDRRFNASRPSLCTPILPGKKEYNRHSYSKCQTTHTVPLYRLLYPPHHLVSPQLTSAT